MNWIIDNKIDATAIAEAANWHLATTIDALHSAGLNRGEAGDFAAYLFCEYATVSDHEPEEYLTDEQYQRLRVVRVVDTPAVNADKYCAGLSTFPTMEAAMLTKPSTIYRVDDGRFLAST